MESIGFTCRKIKFIGYFHDLGLFISKKIEARVICHISVIGNAFNLFSNKILSTILRVEICMEGTLSMSNFKILSSFVCPGPQNSYQKCHQIYSTEKFTELNLHYSILRRNLYGRYP
jgi:hypothetical protein